MSRAIAGLIWTEDDIIMALEDCDVEPTDENIERAIGAVGGDEIEQGMQMINEGIFEAVLSEFE